MRDPRTPPRGMSSRGKQITALVAMGLALFLPKQVECGYPGGECAHANARCRSYEVEPMGFFLLELLAKRDVGFAYSTGENCR